MDDLIQRLRALMAEIEHRLADTRPTPSVGADVGADRPITPYIPMTSKTYGPSMADIPSATRARDIKLDDYIPRDPMHEEGFDPEDFIGSGDRDPLGHDAMSRR